MTKRAYVARMSKTAAIATLLRANRPDLANQVAYAARIRKRKGTRRDSEFVPDLVFDVPVDAKMFWYREGREDEDAGLYVEYQDYEWWWWNIDEKEAEETVKELLDEITEYEDDPDIDIRYRARRLGAR